MEQIKRYFDLGQSGWCDLSPKKWTGLCRSALVFGWRQIPQSGVQAPITIKALDISEQAPSRVISGFVVAMVNAFGFKGVKEAFHRGVAQQSPFRLMDGMRFAVARARR